MTVVDYDSIAHEYDSRYALHDYPGVCQTILDAVGFIQGARVLEVGCGTGKWLAELVAAGCNVTGIDPSEEMLHRASERTSATLQRGFGESLPWAEGSFDVVLYVHSLHHVLAPQAAVEEAFRVLRPGGKFLSIGLDPHELGYRWYVYEFFPEALTLDLERFASIALRTYWLNASGFADVKVRVAEQLRMATSLEDALRDGVLLPSFTSQLTALSEAEYAAGMQRIRDAAAGNSAFRLAVDIALYATEARRPI